MLRSVSKLFAPATGRESVFKSPSFSGIVLTRVRANTSLASSYCDQVHHDYPGQVFNHFISDSIRVDEAADKRTPIGSLIDPEDPYDKKLQIQLKHFAEEFLQRTA